MKWALVRSTAALAALSCGPRYVEPTATERVGIVDGTLSPAADDPVVLLKSDITLCSGVLVAANLVMTARHCFASANAVQVDCQPDGTPADEYGLIFEEADPTTIEVHTGAEFADSAAAWGFEIVATRSSTVCRNDLALLILDRDLSDWPIMPIRLLRPTAIGEALTAIGFGDPGNVQETIEQLGGEVPVRRLRRSGLPVLDVGANRFNDAGGVTVPGTFLLGTSICSGDSGGPAVAESTGAIVGIASIVGAKNCAESSTNAFVQVAQYYEIVLQAFARAGAEPWLEGESGAMSGADRSRSTCAMALPHQSNSRGTMVLLLLVLTMVLKLRRQRGGGSTRSARVLRHLASKLS